MNEEQRLAGLASLAPPQRPPGQIIQTAFVVPDVIAAMPRYTSLLNAGPWFLRRRFTPGAATYRGQPSAVQLSLAFGYAGSMMIELIEQHDNSPSVFRDVVALKGYGFHHYGIATKDFDRALESYVSVGYSVGFTAQRQGRLAIIDTLGDFAGMIELLEMHPSVEAFFASMHQAAVDWDGRDPVRLLPP